MQLKVAPGFDPTAESQEVYSEKSRKVKGGKGGSHLGAALGFVLPYGRFRQSR